MANNNDPIVSLNKIEPQIPCNDIQDKLSVCKTSCYLPATEVTNSRRVQTEYKTLYDLILVISWQKAQADDSAKLPSLTSFDSVYNQYCSCLPKHAE